MIALKNTKTGKPLFLNKNMSTPMLLLTHIAPPNPRKSESMIHLRTYAQENTKKPVFCSVALASRMGNKEMGVVKGLDLNRYMGRWYEIASFPFRFQPCDGINSRATYTVRNDGSVHVLNEIWSGGKRGYIEATAYKVDPESEEVKLKILSRNPHLDDETYNELVQKAKDEGYDVSKLRKTPQSDPPSPEDGSQDTKGIWWIKSFLGINA